jgi:ribosomal protein S12 methylthiotransferase accessory factor
MEIAVDLKEGKKVSARIKEFEIETDQSTKSGGGGTAPAPFDLFLASIATCAGFYVLDFCKTRKIPVDDVRLVMRPRRDDKIRMIDKISIEVQLPADFPEKYKPAIVRAVDLCTVKKHIVQAPEFETYTTIAGR